MTKLYELGTIFFILMMVAFAASYHVAHEDEKATHKQFQEATQ